MNFAMKFAVKELNECECNPPLFQKKSKGHLFRWPFFLLRCYKVKICQKDTAENHLKIQAMLKSQN